MPFERGNHPARAFKGTGDTDIDLTALNLPDDQPLNQILEVDITKREDNTVWIDWVNSTNILLKVKAGVGIDWEIELHGRRYVLNSV